MATVPNPRTWAQLDDFTAARANLELRDALNFLLSPPRVWVYRSAALSIANTGKTEIPFDAEVLDSDAMHDNVTNNSRIICKTAGLFMFICGVQWPSNTSGYRHIQARKNAAGSDVGGTQLFESVTQPPSNSYPIPPFVFFVDLVVNDYIEIFLAQNTAGSLGLTVGQYDVYAQAFWVSK